MTEQIKVGKSAGNRGRGRIKGVPNKATADIKALAQKYGPECIAALVAIMRDKSHPGHIKAAGDLLDRGYGKAAQSLDANLNGQLKIVLSAEDAKVL